MPGKRVWIVFRLIADAPSSVIAGRNLCLHSDGCPNVMGRGHKSAGGLSTILGELILRLQADLEKCNKR
jgi:hypothetical protein